MIKEIKKMFQFEDILESISKEINSPCFDLFLITNKTAYEGTRDYQSIREMTIVSSILRDFSENVLKRKIYINTFREQFLLSKKRIYKQTDSSHRSLGILLGIPDCCIRKYCEENKDSGSWNSAMRYFKQCNDIKVRDKFGVKIAEGTGVFCTYGFIPCSPTCENAIKIWNKCEKIKQKGRELISQDLLNKNDR